MIAEAVSGQLQVEHLGCVPYASAWRLQKRIHTLVADGVAPPTLLLLEHPRTITLGSSGCRSHLLKSDECYREAGIEIHHVERGGQATYHGPGQLVGYLIARVPCRVGDFLRGIEGCLLRALSCWGLSARGSPGYAGVWAGLPEAKIAAIGIAVKRRVSFHGFALNVSTNLEDFALIVPCGMPDQPVTSMARLLGTAPPMHDVADQVAATFSEWMGATQC